jgi:hypothetical protein
MMKILLIAFFSAIYIVHFDFFAQGHPLNQAYYMEILKHLYEAVHKERPEIWPNHWILHHDNAPDYKELSLKQFVAQKSITEMEHPPHSPDLPPNVFWLFPKIKSALKGRRIQDIEDIQTML